MSEGRLGVATTIVGDVDVGPVVPASITRTANLLLTHDGTDATIKVFVRDGTKAAEDLIFPSTLMTATSNARLEITNIVMAAGETLTVESTAIDIQCRLQGFEEAEVT